VHYTSKTSYADDVAAVAKAFHHFGRAKVGKLLIVHIDSPSGAEAVVADGC